MLHQVTGSPGDGLSVEAGAWPAPAALGALPQDSRARESRAAPRCLVHPQTSAAAGKGSVPITSLRFSPAHSTGGSSFKFVTPERSSFHPAWSRPSNYQFAIRSPLSLGTRAPELFVCRHASLPGTVCCCLPQTPIPLHKPVLCRWAWNFVSCSRFCRGMVEVRLMADKRAVTDGTTRCVLPLTSLLSPHRVHIPGPWMEN